MVLLSCIEQLLSQRGERRMLEFVGKLREDGVGFGSGGAHQGPACFGHRTALPSDGAGPGSVGVWIQDPDCNLDSMLPDAGLRRVEQTGHRGQGGGAELHERPGQGVTLGEILDADVGRHRRQGRLVPDPGQSPPRLGGDVRSGVMGERNDVRGGVGVLDLREGMQDAEVIHIGVGQR